jgi:hypothetical protein
MNRQIQMRLHAKSCHNHEQGSVEPVSKNQAEDICIPWSTI